MFLVLEDKLAGMERGIDVENHASFKIFPSRNRYEAYLCHDNEVESVADGTLDQLSKHIRGVKQLCFNESNDYFKLEIPVSIKGTPWLTKDTFKRFLCCVDSKDLVTKAKLIEGELSQLMDARNFHQSLYSQGSQRINGNMGDGRNSSDKPELNRPLLDASRNELLRAMDFRIDALRGELEETLNQAVGTTSSPEELIFLEKFCEHLGALDLRNSVRKFVEAIGRSKISVHASENSPEYDERSNGSRIVDHDTESAMSVHPSAEGKHGVSVKKEAIVDGHSSAESDTSSQNDTQINLALNIPKKITAEAQVRKSLPERPANNNSISNDNINNNNPRFSVGETVSMFREKVSGQAQPNTERSERRMSVKDVISHFESKQREQSSCIQRRKSSDFSAALNNPVLRRWSLGTGEPSAKHTHESDCDDCLTPNSSVSAAATVSLEMKQEVKLEDGGDGDGDADAQQFSQCSSNQFSQCSSSHSPVERTEQEVKCKDGGDSDGDTDGESHTTDTRKETCEMSVTPEQKKTLETDLQRVMLEKTVEGSEKPEDKQLQYDNRGRLYEYYQGKRDKRLRENATKYSEMEEQLRHLKLDLRSMDDETVPANASRRETKRNEADELFKSHNIDSQFLNPTPEISKPDIIKKLPVRTVSLPSRRKSMVPSPSPKTVLTKTTEISTDRPKSVNQKTAIARTSPRPVTQIEKNTQSAIKMETTQNRLQNAKVLQAQAANTKSKFKADTQLRPTTYRKPVLKTKALTVQVESLDSARSSSSVAQKQAKKSSVVPLASKITPRRKQETSPPDDTIKPEAEVSALDEVLVESVIVSEKKPDDSDIDVPPDKEKDSTDQEIDKFDLDSEILGGKVQDLHTAESTHCVYAYNDGDVEMVDAIPMKVPEEESDGGEINEPVVPNPDSDGVMLSESPDQATPVVSSSGRPTTRQSLSQMLQEENSETENIEWGSGENASNVVYQKDAPRGLKRLLKFAQKSIGTANSTTWSSPSAHSEGEEDTIEPRADSQKNSENPATKYDHYSAVNKVRKAGTNGTDQLDPQRLQEDGVFISRASSAKVAAKSFFSLSAFRMSKPGSRRHA